MTRANVFHLSANDLSRIEARRANVLVIGEGAMAVAVALAAPKPGEWCMADVCLDTYAGSLSRLRDSFAGGDPAWPEIAELSYDPLHRLVLDLARCCFASLDSGEAAPSEFAMQAAMETLGVDSGAVLFARVMAAARSFDEERRARFHHLTVHCAKITPDEQAFMNIVALARIDRPAQALRATMTLTRTDACPATFATIELLGAECAKLEAAGPLAKVHFDWRAPETAH
jgi:hypothetical protein